MGQRKQRQADLDVKYIMHIVLPCSHGCSGSDYDSFVMFVCNTRILVKNNYRYIL